MAAAGALFLGIRQQREALVDVRASAAPGDPRALAPHAVGAASVAAPVAGSSAAAAPAMGEDEPTLTPGQDALETAVLQATLASTPGGVRRPVGVPEQTRRSGRGESQGVFGQDDDPPGEPAAEPVLASEVSRLGQRHDEVLVIDGRPRYHLAACAHLAGHDSQPLPVSEAIELGFTGCAACAAATTLLGQPPRS
jgi:hypothetical protein